MKTGRLSKEEWDFIERNAELMTPEQIAHSLNRDIAPVQNYLRKIGKSLNKQADFEVQAEYDLKSRPYWKEIKSQFTEEELELFVYHWSQIVGQFKLEVFPTEELQVVDVIKFEMLMNRALKNQSDCIRKISEIEGELIKEKKILRGIDDPVEKVAQRDLVFELEKQVANLIVARESLSRDFKELQDKKSKLIKDIKGTRDQRVDKVESSKQTFATLVASLIKDPTYRDECSLEMEKMRVAIQAEKERLGSFHQFGTEVDRCLLSDETVNMGE